MKQKTRRRPIPPPAASAPDPVPVVVAPVAEAPPVVVDSCVTCRYVAPLPQTPGKGYCRRYPPSRHNHGWSEYPTVYLEDWCGEYRATL